MAMVLFAVRSSLDKAHVALGFLIVVLGGRTLLVPLAVRDRAVGVLRVMPSQPFRPTIWWARRCNGWPEPSRTVACSCTRVRAMEGETRFSSVDSTSCSRFARS
jgi:hypothetical protein